MMKDAIFKSHWERAQSHVVLDVDTAQRLLSPLILGNPSRIFNCYRMAAPTPTTKSVLNQISLHPWFCDFTLEKNQP